MSKNAAEADVPPEERAAVFVTNANPRIMAKINREMRQRLYLMGKRLIGDERSPLGIEFYVMGEIGKTFTVKLRQFPSCQCGDFLLQRLCKHLMFVSSRVLKLRKDDPLIWQRALLPSEIKSIIQNPAITPVKPKSKFRRLKESLLMGYGPHDILQHDPMYCPVCYEEVNLFEEDILKPEESPVEEPFSQTKPKLDMGNKAPTSSVAVSLGAAPPGETKVEEVTVTQPGVESKPGLFEPLLFCPEKNCEVLGCVKIVHRFCWLKWNRFCRSRPKGGNRNLGSSSIEAQTELNRFSKVIAQE